MAMLVGDPGIEPGAGRPGGVTVRCRTLQLVAHSWTFAGPMRGVDYSRCSGASTGNSPRNALKASPCRTVARGHVRVIWRRWWALPSCAAGLARAKTGKGRPLRPEDA